MTRIRSWRRRDETGFTLIELMVVVLIIAILIAIAIPTFLGARQRAGDRAVESNVRNAFTATRIYYTDKQYYTTSATEMIQIEPSLSWVTTPLDGSSAENSVFISVYDIPSTAQTVIVGARTSIGRCFFLKDVMGGATSGTYFAKNVSGNATCSAPDPADPSWGDTWG